MGIGHKPHARACAENPGVRAPPRPAAHRLSGGSGRVICSNRRTARRASFATSLRNAMPPSTHSRADSSPSRRSSACFPRRQRPARGFRDDREAPCAPGTTEPRAIRPPALPSPAMSRTGSALGYRIARTACIRRHRAHARRSRSPSRNSPRDFRCTQQACDQCVRWSQEPHNRTPESPLKQTRRRRSKPAK